MTKRKDDAPQKIGDQRHGLGNRIKDKDKGGTHDKPQRDLTSDGQPYGLGNRLTKPEK